VVRPGAIPLGWLWAILSLVAISPRFRRRP
jgi:hypothetical protein